MAQADSPAPQRSHARSNRARILEVARRELSANPEVSLDEIARAAGVVRRTLYGHFSGRTALLDALGDEAGQAMQRAVDEAKNSADSPQQALARVTLEIWQVGDRYRMLVGLARRDLGEERLHQLVLPATEYYTEVLARGQAAGVFHSRLPAPVLSAVQRGIVLSLLESVNTGSWEDDGRQAAATALIAAGVGADHAGAVVDSLDGD